MNARLKVLHEKANVKTVKLLPTTVIGRSTECDLKISASEVSRIHCRITVQDDAVFVEDLGSANGTFVNDEMLKPRQRVAVDPGAKITIGPAEFVVDYVAPTSNTVVVRRTDKDGKAAPAPSRNDAESDNKELIFSSIPEATEVSSAEATLVTDPKENLIHIAKAKQVVSRDASPDNEPRENISTAAVQIATQSKKAIPTVPPPARAPLPVSDAVGVAPKNPIIDAPKPATPEPKPAVAVAKPAVDVPVAPPKAKAVAVTASTVPTAKSVPSETRPTAPISPPREVAPAQVAAPAVVPGPKFVVADPIAPVPQSMESPPAFEEAAQFNFEQSSGPRRIPKTAPNPGKTGGLKSLLSVFGRKPTATPPNTSASPLETEEVEQPALEAPGVPVAPPIAAESSFSFGATEQETEADGETTEEPPAADDFQNFLRQF